MDDFVTLHAYLRDLEPRKDTMKTQFCYVNDLYDLMNRYEISHPEADKNNADNLTKVYNTFNTQHIKAETDVADSTDYFQNQLTESIPKLQKDIKEQIVSQKNDVIRDKDADAQVVINLLKALSVDLKSLEDEAKKTKEQQDILGMEVTQYEDIKLARIDLNLKTDLWNAQQSWVEFSQLNSECKFTELDVMALEKSIKKYHSTATVAASRLQDNPVPDELKDRIKVLLDILPVVRDLKSTSLLPRHWSEINRILGHEMPIEEDLDFNIGKLLQLKAADHRDEVAVVANKASQESQLQNQLDGVISTWAELKLPLNQHPENKDVYVLGNLEDLMTELDNSLMTMGTILGSSFVEPLRDLVTAWNDKLLLFSDTLGEWATCQRSWLYLESVFTSPDIKRQLANDATEFAKVDRGWKTIMSRAHDTENAIQLIEMPGVDLKGNFISYNEKLDTITKSLNRYLNTKRVAFPRFYFLSNEELLKILAHAKDPLAVQPHLPKCFEAIHTLDFGGDGNKDIRSMNSPEGEKIPLANGLKARNMVEVWLNGLEKHMRDTLKKLMKQGVVSLETEQRGDWIKSKFAQIVMTVSQIAWARGCEQAILSEDPIEAMERWYDYQNMQLAELTTFARTDLTKIQRKKIVALITTDVHGRDIVKDMIDEKVVHLNTFMWQQQLRFYWDTNEDDCLVRQSNAVFKYGYEYMGVTSRLVITPLTDRCWMTITGALHIRFGAAPAGPAGTGKTESTKDLAKALGFWCIVFNCSEQITFETTAKHFSGLAQCGAWTCLDEFNRIDIEVLSVIAQQLLQVRNALLLNSTEFLFQGDTIKLSENFGVMITMNPGYAGRTELPDNLKVLFRPVSMMIPDYALIAKIMLYAEGFDTAPELAVKMTKLYKLSSEQLSQQPHYDFGMRAVKSVLVIILLEPTQLSLPPSFMLITSHVSISLSIISYNSFFKLRSWPVL